MSEKDSTNDAKKLMTELDDLIDFLADGPEAQQEMRLGQKELINQKGKTKDLGLEGVPVLITPVDSEKPLENKAEINQEIDQLIDEVVSKLVPRLELELRLRLRPKISASSD